MYIHWRAIVSIYLANSYIFSSLAIAHDKSQDKAQREKEQRDKEQHEDGTEVISSSGEETEMEENGKSSPRPRSKRSLDNQNGNDGEGSPPKRTKLTNGHDKSPDSTRKVRNGVNGKNREKTADKSDDEDNMTEDEETATKQKNVGFNYGHKPDTILGASDSTGTLEFLIKWKGFDKATLVPASIANKKCPQHVIQFYESRLSWHSDRE